MGVQVIRRGRSCHIVSPVAWIFFNKSKKQKKKKKMFVFFNV